MLKVKAKDALSLFLYALSNTLLSFGIIYIINNVLAGNEQFLKDYTVIVFLAFVGYAYLLNIIFQKRLNRYSFERLYQNEKKLFDRILNSPMAVMEKYGTERFYTAMEDLRLFSNLPNTVTHTVSSVLMLVLGIIYMFTLSVKAALIVLGLVLLVAACYFVVMNSMSGKVALLRKFNEEYYQYVRDLITGFKELKMSRVRRNNMMNNYLKPNRDKTEHLDFKVSYVFLSINMISQYGLYFVIAVILFGLPALGMLEREDVIAYVVVILFISGPINNLVNLQQMYTRFSVASRRIKKFMNDFDAGDSYKHTLTENSLTSFESLDFKDVCFSYNANNDEAFALGPVNLKIKKGEILFVIGGNGSGKSTFISLLTGLHNPSRGSIIVNNDKCIEPKNLQEFITAVFTDNYIFANNYDDYSLENNPAYQELLKTMNLDKVVEDDQEGSARRRFSKGQGKRMAMIFSLLERKPIIVLDEWAADQDPHFRKYFYEVLIPRLKEQGKTIIAVTHDDAYFQYADRIVKFDYGHIVKDINTNSSEPILEDFWS